MTPQCASDTKNALQKKIPPGLPDRTQWGPPYVSILRSALQGCGSSSAPFASSPDAYVRLTSNACLPWTWRACGAAQGSGGPGGVGGAARRPTATPRVKPSTGTWDTASSAGKKRGGTGAGDEWRAGWGWARCGRWPDGSGAGSGAARAGSLAGPCCGRWRGCPGGGIWRGGSGVWALSPSAASCFYNRPCDRGALSPPL